MFCFIIPTLVPVYCWGETWYMSFMSQAVLRYLFGLNFTWLVNSAAHMWGYKSYDSKLYKTRTKTITSNIIFELLCSSLKLLKLTFHSRFVLNLICMLDTFLLLLFKKFNKLKKWNIEHLGSQDTKLAKLAKLATGCKTDSGFTKWNLWNNRLKIISLSFLKKPLPQRLQSSKKKIIPLTPAFYGDF